MAKDETQKKIDSVLKKLSKKLPEGSFYRLSEQGNVEVLPTGIATLDYALGIGGFARGWQHMIFGASSAGKSALVLQSMGNYQKNHPESICAVIDLEKSMTPEWASKFGVDPERLVIIRPTTTDEMVTMSMQAVTSQVFDFIMVDSLGAGMLQVELDNDKNRVAGSAGNITRLVKAINSAFISLEREKKILIDAGDEDGANEIVVPAVILINQVRVNMNSMYGEDSYPGGKALGHMCGTITQLRVSKASADKVMGTVDGAQMRVGWMCNATVNKNKLAIPGRSAGYTFVYKNCKEHPFGIDNARSIADLALTLGVVRVQGNSIFFDRNGQEEKVVGRGKFNTLVHDDEELQKIFAEEISRIMSNDASDEDLEAIMNLNIEPEEVLIEDNKED